MILLLDTHAILWWLDDPTSLSAAAREAITDPENEVFVSAVSAWEIAIKRGLGKLDAPADFAITIETCGFQSLPITIAHGLATEQLPPHHRDPFDRMLIAQAQLENATLITRDPLIAMYQVPIIRC